MERKPRKAGNPLPDNIELPKATEAERGLASISLNHPQTVLNRMTELKFDPRDIFDPLSSTIVHVVLEQTSRNASTDIRVIFEKIREKLPQTEFHHLSEIWTLMPIESAFDELADVVRSTSKRRALLAVVHQTLSDVINPELKTADLVSALAMQVDGLAREMAPPSAHDTKTLLLQAIERYSTGDDQTQRIRTGFAKLDNLTPIRYGDFLVIGGETKSGKTMLALNIIANLITNESNTN